MASDIFEEGDNGEFVLELTPYQAPMHRTACLSADARYRYLLTRTWQPDLPTVCFVMLNPSTADAEADDPTIRRCIDFARRWGFGSLNVVNLYAYRTASPAELAAAAEPVGPENDAYVGATCANASLIVAAWGAMAPDMQRKFVALSGIKNLKCLGLTQNGEPRHPLYVRADTGLQPFNLVT